MNPNTTAQFILYTTLMILGIIVVTGFGIIILLVDAMRSTKRFLLKIWKDRRNKEK